ncbi:myogenesis-regulating glycosidase, partial [Folsomia candida]|uniref:myogenesis-regulating glycosidase n=1 Tax=Folsomia candida TaxID=158441 RepID=UPI00160511FD
FYSSINNINTWYHKKLVWGIAIILGIQGDSCYAEKNFEIRNQIGRSASPIDFSYNGVIKLSGLLGVSLPDSVGEGVIVDCAPTDPTIECRVYGDFANATITTSVDNCARVEWSSTYARRLEDCFNVGSGDYIYGGSETLNQYWPVNADKKNENPYITSDFLGGYEFGDLLENYWLFSKGAAVHVDEENPLFVSWDTNRPGQICFVSADAYPYDKRDVLTLKYTVCTGDNVKTVHQANFNKFYQKPTGLPDQTMLIRPLWSTWAQYKTDVNQSIVLDYANQVMSRGFELSSHIEIDDKWEPCYGQEEFDFNKFPDPAEMVSQIKAMNLRVTLWIHPFINFGCDLFTTAVNDDYFMKDQKGKAAITSWWAGSNAGVIDTNNERAVTWWRARLERLRTEYGIDSFKFDAGEVNWLPYSRSLEGNQDLAPNTYTTKYIEAIAPFGGLVEARVGRLSQEHPIFVRMLDKLSHWGYDAGLKSMIPTALLFGILGYPFVLPDMIGGNAYGDWPTKELYIRWLQVNVFMPAIQFSIVPWDSHFDDQTIEICIKILSIREQYKDEILIAANQAVADGTPINRPLWWVDPTDSETFTVGQEYMLGENILVAPVVEEGATTLDIYLPIGNWRSGVTNLTYVGPGWLRNVDAPLDIVNFYIKE